MNNFTPTSVKPILFVLTSHNQKGESGEPTGFYLPEVTHPMFVLESSGIKVELASIKGGLPPVDGLDLEDKLNALYWNDPAFQSKLQNTQPVNEVDTSRYSGVFYAGGHGTMWDFPENEAIKKITREIYENGGIVGAVCHGPSALVNVTLSDGSYLIKDKKISAFTDAEEHAVGLEKVVPFLLGSTLLKRGAMHEAAENWECKVVVDQRLVTGQNPQSATKIGEAMRDLLLNGKS